MTPDRWIAAVALACAALVSTPCAAQDAAADAAHGDPAPHDGPEERPLSPIARGRALGWGVSAIVPLYLGDVRAADGTAIGYLNPGGGVEGRIFYELPGGIGLGAHGGVMVSASNDTRALVSYRGAADVRWTIDVGSLELAPLVAISIGVLIGQLDEATVVTGFARVLGGVQWILAPWVVLEAGVSLEGAVGADAFADAIAWISPQIGVTFYE